MKHAIHLFIVIALVCLSGARGKLTPYDASAHSPSIASIASSAARLADLQKLLNEAISKKIELQNNLSETESSLSAARSKLTDAVGSENYEEAAALKATLTTLGADKTRYEASLAATQGTIRETEASIKDIRVQTIRAEVSSLDGPAVLAEKARAAYKQQLTRKFEKWDKILKRAKLVLHYIMGNAVQAGARDVRVGHFPTFQEFKNLVAKENAAAKQKLLLVADDMLKHFTPWKDRNQNVKLELSVGSDFDDEILLETGIANFFGRYVCSTTVSNLFNWDYRIKPISTGQECTFEVFDSLKGNAPVAALWLTDGMWLGARPCHHQRSCLRLRPLMDDLYEVPLNEALFKLYSNFNIKKLANDYNNLFDLYVQFDGAPIEGYDSTMMRNIFPDNKDLASFHQVLCNPVLASALVYDYWQKGYNMSMTENVNSKKQNKLKVGGRYSIGEENSDFLNFVLKSQNTSSSDDSSRLYPAYQEYIVSWMDVTRVSIIDTMLLWDIWNPVADSAEAALLWVKDRVPLVKDVARAMLKKQ